MKSQKKYLTLAWSAAAALFFVAGTQSAMAQFTATPGSIVNSRHDFSPTSPSSYKGASDQMCVYCHTPHNASTVAGTPALWNRALPSATYTVYTSGSMNATTGQPGVVSKLCLSCHDGTVAVDTYGIAPAPIQNPASTNKVLGAANLGTDLSNDHPIGITYDAALVTLEPGLKAVTSNAFIGNQTSGTIATKMLFSGKLECASCHDVHNSASGTAVTSKLLRISNSSSALCLTCHIK